MSRSRDKGFEKGDILRDRVHAQRKRKMSKEKVEQGFKRVNRSVNKEEICQKAVDNWGYIPQLIKLQEEAGELATAILKFDKEDMTEEVADLEIMIKQAQIIIEALKPVLDQELVDNKLEEKLSRLNQIIEKEAKRGISE